MQNAYLSSSPGRLTNLFTRRTAENNHASARESSDALVLRILDEAASRRPPTGLFDPLEADLPQGSSHSAFDPQNVYGSQESGRADALIQRILDDAISKRPPMGLFDTWETDAPQRASHSAFDPQTVYGSQVPQGSDALIPQILDDAASKRPPISLFDPKASGLQALTSQDLSGAFWPMPGVQRVLTTERGGLDAWLQHGGVGGNAVAYPSNLSAPSRSNLPVPSQYNLPTPYRYTHPGESFLRYEIGPPEPSRVTPLGGLTPGAYVAPSSQGVLPSNVLNDYYALPRSEVPRTQVFNVNPPLGTSIIGPRPVSGGIGAEAQFPFGAAPGTVTQPPLPVPGSPQSAAVTPPGPAPVTPTASPAGALRPQPLPELATRMRMPPALFRLFIP